MKIYFTCLVSGLLVGAGYGYGIEWLHQRSMPPNIETLSPATFEVLSAGAYGVAGLGLGLTLAIAMSLYRWVKRRNLNRRHSANAPIA